MNVLIVEDDGIISLYLKECIEELGHNVVAVLHHSYDVETFDKFHGIDLVLMDINIYGPKDGIMLARRIFEQYRVRSVFITSYQDSETLQSAMQANPLWYITKPIKESDVETFLLMAQNQLHEIPTTPTESTYIGKYRYDAKKALFFDGTTPLKLGSIEVGILLLLFKNVNNVVPIETLIEAFWPDNADGIKKLRDSIYRIRKKLPDITIESFPKMGYLLKSVNDVQEHTH